MSVADVWAGRAGTPLPPRTIQSPLDGRELHALPQSSGEDVDAAFAAARIAGHEWAQRSFAERRALLLRAHDLVLERAEELGEIARHETGKTRGQALEEVLIAASSTRYNALSAHRVLRAQRRRAGLPFITRTTVRFQPKGVVGVITPWNYPLSLTALDVIAALAAGNAVVQKIDEQGAWSALALRRAFIDAGLPEHVWIVVAGAAAVVGERLTDLADYICFTGSTATGRHIAQKAGSRLVGASLELGGKNALIVLNDVDPGRAAEHARYACFAAMGQLCVSAERIYVHRDVADEFQEALVAAASDARLGAAPDADFGTLTSAAQVERVQAHLDDALSKGASVLVGGSRRPDLGPYAFEPTILTGVTPDMHCYADETFGALAALHIVDSEDEAIALANASDYGLNAAVLSGSTARARAVAARLQAGTVNINEGYRASFSAVDAPMGGVKQSGVGRRNGAEGLLRFVEPITIAWTTGVLRLPSSAADFARLGGLMLFAMRVLKALRIR
ncbi:MAG TPA: succinic semialdehyde dehydrogenase [Microbacteriaceae bacterium]|nr:succinic semialdehyde dehydrogenase [Microbacteriaceae bacterium]